MNPRQHCRLGPLVYGSPEVLTCNSPTRYFQLHTAAVLQVRFSAKKIDAATSRESFQRFVDSPWGSDFHQAAVPDSYT
jgi:hypothetical protein